MRRRDHLVILQGFVPAVLAAGSGYRDRGRQPGGESPRYLHRGPAGLGGWLGQAVDASQERLAFPE